MFCRHHDARQINAGIVSTDAIEAAERDDDAPDDTPADAGAAEDESAAASIARRVRSSAPRCPVRARRLLSRELRASGREPSS